MLVFLDRFPYASYLGKLILSFGSINSFSIVIFFPSFSLEEFSELKEK